MNRIDRLTAMILMLQSHRVVTAEQMAEHFEISVRTVYRDLSALGEVGVPIVAEAGVGYRLMPGYHMPPVTFTEEEAVALFMSGELAEKFGEDSLKNSMRGALLKVRAALPEEKKEYLQRLGESVRVWAPASASPDQSALMKIQNAVVKRRCIKLSYDTGGKGVITERVVEALGVLYYANHWHLIGWCRYREGFRDFRLDRMKEWAVLEEVFSGHEDFLLMDFLQDQENTCDLIPVTVECDAWVRERVLAEMPARIVRQVDLPGDGVRVDAFAYSLDWLSSWLLGFGSSVRACSPPVLQEKIRQAAQEILAQYQKKEMLLT